MPKKAVTILFCMLPSRTNWLQPLSILLGGFKVWSSVWLIFNARRVQSLLGVKQDLELQNLFLGKKVDMPINFHVPPWSDVKLI